MAAMAASGMRCFTNGHPEFDDIKGSPTLLNATQMAASVVIGAAVGAAATFNADANNRQLHPDERAWAKQHAMKYTDWLRTAKCWTVSQNTVGK